MWSLVASEGRDILLDALAAAFLLQPTSWQEQRHRDLRRLSYTEKRSRGGGTALSRSTRTIACFRAFANAIVVTWKAPTPSF